MNQHNPIKNLTIGDILEGWQIYDTDKDKLEAFIKEFPSAKLAHDAAVKSLMDGDEAGRSVWEGFLRCLFIVAHNIDGKLLEAN